MPSNKKRVLNQIKINPDTLSRLIDWSNRQGKTVGDLAGEVLDTAMIDWEKPDPKDAPKYVSWLFHRAQVKQRMINQIIMTAAQHAEHKTEVTADILDEMCSAAGLSTTHVLEQVTDNPMADIAIKEGSAKTPKGRAMAWLPKFLVDHDGRADHPVIMQAARRLGFEQRHVQSARDALNRGAIADMVGKNRLVKIKSFKESAVWTWELEVIELGDEQDE